MENIKLSVIVPIYNTEKFLSKCIDSIINQTLQKKIEIILINDGSTDNSHNICLKYIEKYPEKIKYINNKNIGCSATRNLGIEIAQGEYIAFVDSDDYIEKTMYEELISMAEKEKKDIVICGINYIDLGNSNIQEDIPKPLKSKYDFLLKENKIGNTYNKIFKKDLIIKNNIIFPINTHCVEDLVFCFKATMSTNKIGYVYKSFYNYILHGNNSIYNLKKRLGVFISFDDIYKFIEDRKLITDEELMDKFYKLYNFYAIEWTFNMLSDFKKVSKEDYKKYKKIFTEKLNEQKFLNFNSKILIMKSKLKIYLKRNWIIYFIFKKVKNIFNN